MIETRERCQNCDTPLQGKFCHTCGQKQIEPHERTFKYLATQFLSAAFNLEKNFLKSLWLLVSKPGFLAHQYVKGKRKRYMQPFSVFLLINFFYFIFSPMSDFNISLKDQVSIQPYSSIAKKMVDRKIEKEEITFEAYEIKYWNWSLTLSQTLIILNVPITAFFLTIWFRRTGLYFADHFIYALYFYSFTLLFVQLYFNLLSTEWFAGFEWLVARAVPLTIFLLYTFLSLKRFYSSPSKIGPVVNCDDSDYSHNSFYVSSHFISCFICSNLITACYPLP